LKITIIGTGYVGLVTGTCLAEMGNEVLCLDVDPLKIEMLNRGEIPIFEPGLEAMVQKNCREGRLRFTTDIVESVDYGLLQFIAVGTPPDEDGSADLQYVLTAARNIGRYMTHDVTIVDKSTVPVGTALRVKEVVKEELQKRGVDLPFSVASNPEFLKEGAAIDDFMRPDRIIIGADSEMAIHRLRNLYAPFQRNHERVLVMDISSAELTKYAANAMLATRISFMNELAQLAEKLGADIEHVRQGVGSDIRIGYHFLYAGCGYGGSCFPKDVQALQRRALDEGMNLRIIDAVQKVNEDQKQILVDKVFARFGRDLEGYHFALWGLAFKPNTDDMREAPSRAVIGKLLEHGATVCAYDPAAMHEAQRVFGNKTGLTYATSAMEALDSADALIIVTEWKSFRSPDFGLIISKLKAPVIFDGRNLYELEEMKQAGFEYYPIGRRLS